MKKGAEKVHVGLDSKGTLRAAIFGVNDGLVSNTSLIVGVASALPSGQAVIIAGIAGLLSGAFSMAAGEYISIRSQRELFERQIEIEKQELKTMPEKEEHELAQIYQSRGLPAKSAKTIARELMRMPDVALNAHAREELGLNPDELGSPWDAAISSFVAFAMGAAIPLLPFAVFSGTTAAMVSAGCGIGSLFVVGAMLSRFTGRNALYSGSRMMLIGCGAVAITFAIGRLLSVSLS